MAIVLITFILIIPILIYYLYGSLRRIYLISKIPGPPGLPLIGNDFIFLVSRIELWHLMRRFMNKYYPILKFWNLGWPVVNIRHPDDAEVLLSNPKYMAKSVLYKFLHPWFKTGLLTSAGSKWHSRRKTLTPAFHFNVLQEFVTIFDERGRRMVQQLKENEDKIEYDLLPLVTRYTLDTICETAMGTSLEKMDEFQYKYRQAVHDMGTALLHRLLRPWLHPTFLFNLTPTGRKHNESLEIIHGFSSKIIRERQAYHENTGGVYLKTDNALKMKSSSKKRLAMLDLLIAAMKEGDIDEAGIREEVDTFIFEGHDTTGMAMFFSLLLLAEHGDIQQRCREEIDAVLDKSNGKMNIADLQQLTYLDRCLKEVLRLYPSVPLISRHVGEDMHLKNYTIPGGAIVHLHIYDMHRDPNFWPDPEKFDPDRFLPEETINRHPFSYVPFSAGQRNCIGQKFALFELKAFLGHLLHNFVLEPIDIASKVQLVPDLVLRPTKPVYIKFVPR